MNTIHNINEIEIDNFILNLKQNLNNELNKNIEINNFNNKINNFNNDNIKQYYNGFLISRNNKFQEYINHMDFLFNINNNLYYIKKQIFFYNKSEYFVNTNETEIYNIRINELKHIKRELIDLKQRFINYLKIYIKNVRFVIKDISSQLKNDILTIYSNDKYILMINNDFENISSHIDLSIYNLNKYIIRIKKYQKYKNNFLYYGKRLSILSIGLLVYYLY